MEVLEIEDDQPLLTPLVRLPFPDLLSDERRQDYLNYGIPLYQAALKGDWGNARAILALYPACITARITKQGDTLLHVAAAARHTYFVEELVKLMSAENNMTNNQLIHELALQNNVGNTALCLAAASGTVSIAEVMVQAYNGLHLVRGNGGLTPLHMAALLGHRDLVWYLWRLIRTGDLTDAELIALFISTINTDLYDVALTILEQYPELAIARDECQDEQTPLHVLARKTNKCVGRQPTCIWRRWCKTFGIKCGGYTENTPQHLALKLVDRLWAEVIRQTEDNLADLLRKPWRLIFVAVREGNVEFLTILIRSYPDLLWKFDENGRSLFHVAIMYRQEKIFRLIYKIGAIKDLLAMYTDDEENSMLHLAAKLPSSDRLNCISGAALQMQQEILWFKVVEDLMQPQLAEAQNNARKTPRALFTEEHKNLRKEGEVWIRKTASSCSVVATLIASVVFGAILQVPSSSSDSIANPDHHHAVWYWVFAISDSLSLISSTASILMFLSILTSRYAEEDFLRSLPLKLMIGLTLLFVSIASMMIAFTATFSIIFKHGLLWIGTSVLASVPITMFAIQEFPLLLEVYRSTIRCKFVLKPPYQLF